jgi:hypothetical protein
MKRLSDELSDESHDRLFEGCTPEQRGNARGDALNWVRSSNGNQRLDPLGEFSKIDEVLDESPSAETLGTAGTGLWSMLINELT